MGQQLRPEFQGQRLDAGSPRQRRIGEPVVVDPAQELLDQTAQYRGLVREIGVHGVGCDSDPGRDAPDRDPLRATLGEQSKRRVEDRLLAERPPRTPRHIDHLPPARTLSRNPWTASSNWTPYKF